MLVLHSIFSLREPMNFDEVVQYWIELADADWPVVGHLFNSGDYRYALFFGHLYLEKLLKALVVKVTQSHAPRTHNLISLVESTNLDILDSMRNTLIRVTGYSIETRYPDDFASTRKHYTREYCEKEIKTIQEVGKWLKSKLMSAKK